VERLATGSSSWGHRMSRHPRNLSGKTTAFQGRSTCAGELLNGCGRRFILAIIPAPELDFIPASQPAGCTATGGD